MILLGHVEAATLLSIRLKRAKSEKIHQGISSEVPRRRGIDLALWHDRHFRLIFRRLFSYTSNPIATGRTLCFLVGLALTSLMVTELSRFTTFAIGHCSALFTCEFIMYHWFRFDDVSKLLYQASSSLKSSRYSIIMRFLRKRWRTSVNVSSSSFTCCHCSQSLLSSRCSSKMLF